MKKIFAVLLALTLVLSMGTIALAADDGTITISEAVPGTTYKAYQMLTFVPSGETDANGKPTGVYKVANGWDAFFKKATDEDATVGVGLTYFDVSDVDGAVTMKANADVAQLAKDAIAYAATLNPTGTATVAENATTATISNLPLGYYAIDTSLGTICSLTTTTPDAAITEKNAKPEIDKEVQEDSKVIADNDIADTEEGWGKVNDADIDQVVNYKATITVATGAVNYVMHDTMSDGLTFNPDSVDVKLSDGTEVATDKYAVTTPGAKDSCTFEVAFDNAYIATLPAGTKIVVTYSATLNDQAVVAGDGNSNKVVLKYGDNNEFTTSEKETKTYTWKMDVLKWTKGDNDSKIALAGATFQLLKDGTPLTFTRVADTDGVPTYMHDKTGTTTDITTGENGKFIIVGLDEGIYALHEEVAPVGYNKLASDIEVVIEHVTYEDEPLKLTYTINDAEPATIEVENKTGSLLPETGGIGTTIFYVVGGLLMAAAFILLVSKKRMASFA